MKKALLLLKDSKLLKILILMLIIVLVSSVCLLLSDKRKTILPPKKTVNTAEIKRLTDIADVYFDTNKKDSAIYFFKKVKKLCDPEKNTIDYVYALSCISELQFQLYDFNASEASATEALPYLKRIKNPRYSWIVYNLLGLNYMDKFDNENAILYFKKAMKLKSSAWRKRVAINNLSIVYMQQKKYKEAEVLLKILVSKKNISSDANINDSDYAFIKDNLGFCYYNQGNYKKALEYYYEALKIRLNPKTTDGLAVSYRRLSLYFRERNSKLAKMYAKLAFETDSKNNSPSGKVHSLAYLIKSSDDNGLKKYSLKYIQLVKSLELTRLKSRNQFAAIKYSSQKDKEENLMLKTQQIENDLQIEREKNRIIISYVILVFVLSFLLFLSFYLTSKGKKEKTDAIFKSEIRISEKLHNELTTKVYNTILLAENNNLETDENKEQLLNNLDSLYHKTRNISRENSIIKTDKNYDWALREMISGFKTENLNILLTGFDAVQWLQIDKNKKITLYRIIQELLTNMKKHSNANLVGINFKKMQKNITIVYTDNGKGIDMTTTEFKNGLQNIETRIFNIKGKVNIDSAPNKGFKVTFNFPA